MARSRQARSVETRTRLLDAATRLIAREGIEGASVDAIAAAAQRTSGSLYGQFGSKDGLIVELLDRSKDTVARRIDREVAASDSLDERLAATWRNFVEPPTSARDWTRLEHELWVWATRPGNADARERLADRYGAIHRLLAAGLETWKAEGLIDPPYPPDRTAAVMVAALIGLEMTYRLDPAAVDEATAVAALRALLRGRGAGTATRATADRSDNHEPSGGSREAR